MIDLIVAQWIAWLWLSGLLFITLAAELGAEIAFKSIYTLLRPSTVYNWYRDSTLYNFWIYTFTVISYSVLFPISLISTINSLVFRIPYRIFTGTVTEGTMSWLFQDKAKVRNKNGR